MTKKELVLEAIEKLGYKPKVDDDGDIIIRYQMKSIFVLMGDEDDRYLSVMLPQFHEIEDGEETLVLATCNKLTRDIKLLKVYVDQTFKNVSATCEFYFTDTESLEQNIENSLNLLGVTRSLFRKEKSNLEN